MAYSKELTLFFLASFYFVIATNTQTGWLFVLSAFLLGLLSLSWYLSRRSLEGLTLQQQWLNDPQKNHPFPVSLCLINNGERSAQEVRVEWPQPQWASPCRQLGWTIPRLGPGMVAKTELSFTPKKRGEHKLPPLTLVGGAPFGLFQVKQTFQLQDTFLVFPEIERLPSPRSRSSLAVALGDVTSFRGLGETRNIRSVREYRPGDDLRDVHWKASAKRSPSSPLLLREHHSHAPKKSVLLIDTSYDSEDDTLFERAVTLAASTLWSAHREGAKVWLLALSPSGEWQLHRQWPSQYRALAKVCRDREMSFESWVASSEQAVRELFEQNPGKLTLIKAQSSPIERWPSWLHTVLLLTQTGLPPDDNPEGVRVVLVPPQDQHGPGAEGAAQHV